MDGKIVVTGASGFVGNALATRFHQENYEVLGLSRQQLDAVFPVTQVYSLGADKLPSHIFTDCAVIIHCAARTHVMNEVVADPLAEYRRVNVDDTRNLARKAAAQGVRRFIFISSIKVNGEQTPLGKPFRVEDEPAPEDPYGISKLEAEQVLQSISAETGMEVVIVRPPLVYGPGVKGNFASMLRLVAKGYPLPLGAIHNKRSLVGLDNLVDLIRACIEVPSAANQVFLAGDGEDISTSDLLRQAAQVMGKPSRLLPVPASLLQAGATLLGKKAVGQRLLGSLQIDITTTREKLGWQPPYSLNQGLKRCVDDSLI